MNVNNEFLQKTASFINDSVELVNETVAENQMHQEKFASFAEQLTNSMVDAGFFSGADRDARHQELVEGGLDKAASWFEFLAGEVASPRSIGEQAEKSSSDEAYAGMSKADAAWCRHWGMTPVPK